MNKIIFKGVGALVFLLSFQLVFHCGGDSDAVTPADLVVKNAVILTSDLQNPEAQAFAVKDGKFMYVGTGDGVTSYLGENTEVIDAQGKMIVPGFVDNHAHLLWMGGLMGIMAFISDSQSLEEMIGVVQQYGQDNPDFPFIIGMGWNYDFYNGMPTIADADAILSDRPLFMWSIDGHTGWVNSLALEKMMSANPQAAEKLTPLYDSQGNPTGIFTEFYIFNPFDYFSEAEVGAEIEQQIFAAMDATLAEALKIGVTTTSDIQLYKSYLPRLARYLQQGKPSNIRVHTAYYVNERDISDETTLIADFNEWKNFGSQHNTEFFYSGAAIKLYSDSTVASHTAYMLDPYSDEPDNYGYPTWPQTDLDRVVQIADSMKLRVGTHAIGDHAIQMVINAYEAAQSSNGAWDSRHTIEHCELPIPSDILRMASLGIYASMQPAHFLGIDQTGEVILGNDRLQRMYPWASLSAAGVNISFGSDWCAGPMNPIYGLISANLRINYKGLIEWGPEQVITIPEAISYWTIGSAKQFKLEEKIGSITPGKYADFVLYSIDLRTVSSPEFLAQHELTWGTMDDFVDKTFVGGQLVYQKAQ